MSSTPAPEAEESGPQLQDASREEVPLVMIGILARNAAHNLPNFLGYLDNLDYPKDRVSVW